MGVQVPLGAPTFRRVMEDWKKLKETVEGMRGKNFSDLTKEERDALETMLRNRASKEGRELLWDVRCVWIE